jgi:hypothetical protein
MGSRGLVIIAVLSGALSGALVVASASFWRATSSKEPDPVGNSTVSPNTPQSNGLNTHVRSVVRGMGAKLATLEGRLEQLEESDRAAQPQDSPPASEEPSVNSAVAFEQHVEQHSQEVRDPSWAGPTETAILEDLEALRDSFKAEVREVSCRNTSCLAVLNWPDRSSALDNWQVPLSTPLRSNCVRRLIVPEAQEGEANVSVRLLFDCESWRAEGSPLLSRETMLSLSMPSQE